MGKVTIGKYHLEDSIGFYLGTQKTVAVKKMS